MINLKSKYSSNVGLKNPVIVASCGLTATAEQFRMIEDAGAGSAVMKSFFEDEKCRRDPTPRYNLIERGTGKLKSYAFYSYEQASPFGPEEYAREISKVKETVDFPVIGSIACTTEKGWERNSKLLEEAGADAIELNLSCPYSDHVKGHRDFMANFIESAIHIAKKSVTIDIVSKMTPQLSSPTTVARIMENSGAKGITAFSRFSGLDINIENESPVLHGGYAGHGGSWSLFYALRWLSEFYPSLTIPISGSGGIQNSDDIIKFIFSGASTTQICTVFYLKGITYVKKLLEGLSDYMERNNYTTISEFKGKICDKILTMHQVDRKQRVKAEVETHLCNKCGICEKICNYNAIGKSEENGYIIDGALCSGCGLCFETCPQNAIKFYNL